MLYNLKDKLNRFLFDTQCKDILKTPPVIEKSTIPVAIVTQLQHKDVLMFLLAIKSFSKYVDVNKVFVINDDSLTLKDISLLNEHIHILTLLDKGDFTAKGCPIGGTWERLLAISKLTKDYYVVQLDSDTLTISDIPEISDHINYEKGFVIGTWDSQIIEPMSISTDRVLKNVTITENSHIQMIAESNFSHLSQYNQLNYVRGCSGFTGFPKQSISTDFIAETSKELEKAIGPKWHEWGSEQVMSNIVVANIKNSTVLPHPKYSDCIKMQEKTTHFIHFIGSCRFKNGIYKNKAQAIISGLHS